MLTNECLGLNAALGSGGLKGLLVNVERCGERCVVEEDRSTQEQPNRRLNVLDLSRIRIRSRWKVEGGKSFRR